LNHNSDAHVEFYSNGDGFTSLWSSKGEIKSGREVYNNYGAHCRDVRARLVTYGFTDERVMRPREALSLSVVFDQSPLKKTVASVFQLPQVIVVNKEVCWDDMIWTDKEMAAMAIAAAGEEGLLRAAHRPGWEHPRSRPLASILQRLWGPDQGKLGSEDNKKRDTAVRRMLQTVMGELVAPLRRMVTPAVMVHKRDKSRREEALRYVYKGAEFWQFVRSAMWKRKQPAKPVEGRATQTIDFGPGMMGVMYSDMVVTVVQEKSPAGVAGVRVGWKLVKVNEADVLSQTQLVQALTKVRGLPYSVTFEFEEDEDLDADFDIDDDEEDTSEDAGNVQPASDSDRVLQQGIFSMFLDD